MDDHKLNIGVFLIVLVWFLILFGVIAHYNHTIKGYNNYRMFVVYLFSLIVYSMLLIWVIY